MSMEPRPGHFEYQLKQALGACDGNMPDMYKVVDNIPAKDIPTAIIKELTVQVPTDDSSANNTVQDVWGATRFYPFSFEQAQPQAGIVAVGDAAVPGGNLGCAVCVMGICVELEGEPEVWTMPGVSVVSADGNAGLAPDAFTAADVGAFVAGNGLLGAHVVPALLDYGTETWRFVENYVRSQNFCWRVGNAVKIYDVPAEDVASCGSDGGPRGLGRADVITTQYVQRVNALYAGITNFTTRSFIAQNATRDGVIPVGDAHAGVSSYQPSRNGDFAKVAFGKERNSSKIYCNARTQWFKNPLYFKEGLPLQLFFEKNNDGTQYLNRALAALGSSYNGEMTPLADGTGVAFPGAGAASFLEWDSRAAAPTTVAQTTPTNRVVYKWGQVKLRVGLKGALLVDDTLQGMFQSMQTNVKGVAATSAVKNFLGGVMNAEQIGRGI